MPGDEALRPHSIPYRSGNRRGERGFEVTEDIEVSAYKSLSRAICRLDCKTSQMMSGLLILQVKRWNWLVSPTQRAPSQSSTSKSRRCISRGRDCTNFNTWAAGGSSVREACPAITFVRMDWIHSEGCRLDTDRRRKGDYCFAF